MTLVLPQRGPTLGTAVFYGMIGVTAFGLFLTPLFYFVVQKFVERKMSATAAVIHAEQPPPPA